MADVELEAARQARPQASMNNIRTMNTTHTAATRTAMPAALEALGAAL